LGNKYLHKLIKGMNMNTAIEKLDELLAKVRAQLIEKKGLKEYEDYLKNNN
jgi:hypothetical protein